MRWRYITQALQLAGRISQLWRLGPDKRHEGVGARGEGGPVQQGEKTYLVTPSETSCRIFLQQCSAAWREEGRN